MDIYVLFSLCLSYVQSIYHLIYGEAANNETVTENERRSLIKLEKHSGKHCENRAKKKVMTTQQLI